MYKKHKFRKINNSHQQDQMGKMWNTHQERKSQQEQRHYSQNRV